MEPVPASMPVPPVVPLGRQQRAAAVTCLARAFAADPLFAAIFPDDARRPHYLRRMFDSEVAERRLSGVMESYPDTGAVAMWQPPGRQPRLVRLRTGLRYWRSLRGYPRADRQRMLTVFGDLERRRARLLPQSHWYLETLGVDPKLQGQHRGSTLVRHGLARADAAGVPAYLETETEQNVRLYERLGFAVLECAVPAGIDCPIWSMRRPAGGT